MEAPKPRILEVTVYSAEDLRVNGKPATKNVFVTVRAESIASHTTAMKGDGGGGGFHSWNEKFDVELGTHARSITFEVKCRQGNVVKDVGVARIAVSDFLGGSVTDNCVQSLSYRLRDWDGLPNGIINFSVRLVAPDCPSSSSEVVTGIPVCRNSNSDSKVGGSGSR